MPAEQQHDLGLDEFLLLVQVRRACLHLVRQRIPVARWPALQDVGDENVCPGEADALEQLVEQLAGRPDEWLPLLILVLPGRLADDHDPGGLWAHAWYRSRSRGAERAPPALLHRGAQGLEVGEVQTGGHCMPRLEARHTTFPQL